MSYPSDSARTKSWGTEILTAADLDGQLDLLHAWINAAMDEVTGHGHTGGTNDGQKIVLTTSVTGTLPTTNGGTGVATYTQGDILYSSASNVLSKLAAGTSGKVLVTLGAGANPYWGYPINPYLKYSNTQSSGTGGGTATSGSWGTVPLNTEDFDTSSIGSISSNQITLPAGTYYTRAVSPFFNTNRAQTRLYNITDSAVILTGSGVICDSGISQTDSSLLEGQFTLSGTTVIELQYQVQTTAATSGLGVAGSFGSEVYAQIEFLLLA